MSCDGEHCGRLGEVRVDALLPAVRAVGSQPEPLGGRRIAAARSSRPRAARRWSSRRPRDSRPPMIAASATGRVGVGDHEVARVERRSVPSSVTELLARRGASYDDPALGEALRGRRRAAGCRARASRSSSRRRRSRSAASRRRRDARRQPGGDGAIAARRGRAGRCSAGSRRGRRSRRRPARRLPARGRVAGSGCELDAGRARRPRVRCRRPRAGPAGLPVTSTSSTSSLSGEDVRERRSRLGRRRAAR